MEKPQGNSPLFIARFHYDIFIYLIITRHSIFSKNSLKRWVFKLIIYCTTGRPSSGQAQDE